jgi:hypothetical protein
MQFVSKDHIQILPKAVQPLFGFMSYKKPTFSFYIYLGFVVNKTFT